MSLSIKRSFRNFIRDIKIGGKFLGGGVESRFAESGAYKTSNSQYEMLEAIFSKMAVKEEDVLVDVGCGKGRVLNFWLMKFPKNTIYGIELDPLIAERTLHRLKKYRNCSIVCGNVIDNIPREGSIFYLFNPFDRNVLEEFKKSLLIKKEGASNLSIIYVNCIHIEVFESDNNWDITWLYRGDSKVYDTALMEIKND